MVLFKKPKAVTGILLDNCLDKLSFSDFLLGVALNTQTCIKQ